MAEKVRAGESDDFHTELAWGRAVMLSERVDGEAAAYRRHLAAKVLAGVPAKPTTEGIKATVTKWLVNQLAEWMEEEGEAGSKGRTAGSKWR